MIIFFDIYDKFARSFSLKTFLEGIDNTSAIYLIRFIKHSKYLLHKMNLDYETSIIF